MHRLLFRASAILLSLAGFFTVRGQAKELQPIPDKLAVPTFDDGNKSDRAFVADVLKKHGFCATFYVTEGLGFLKNKNHYITWQEIRELHDLGFEIRVFPAALGHGLCESSEICIRPKGSKNVMRGADQKPPEESITSLRNPQLRLERSRVALFERQPHIGAHGAGVPRRARLGALRSGGTSSRKAPSRSADRSDALAS